MQKFSGPLEPELMKKYDEQFVLLVLQHCYRAKYDDYVLLDAPDLQSDDKRIIVQNAIRRKTEKIQDYRSKGLQRLGLFVLYEEPIIPVRPDTLVTRFDTVQDDCNDRYDFLFFCYSCGIIHCDYWLQKFEIFPIDPSQYDKIAFQARVK